MAAAKALAGLRVTPLYRRWGIAPRPENAAGLFRQKTNNAFVVRFSSSRQFTDVFPAKAVIQLTLNMISVVKLDPRIRKDDDEV
jgi:hypothetical protein